MKCIDNDIKKYDLLAIPSKLNWLPRREQLLEWRQEIFEIALETHFQDFAAELKESK